MPLYGEGGYGLGRYGIRDTGPIYKQSLGYYLNLIASQYKLSSNFVKWMTLAFQPLDDLSSCLAFMASNFDIDYAMGAQLDILGQIIGVSRTLGFQPRNNISPILDDVTYRLLLKARIAWNHWNGRTVSLYPIWKILFGSGNIIINDNQNMTATIIVTGTFTSIIQDLITNGLIVPRPEGVQYTYSFGVLPALGADENNEFIAGADLGHAS